MKNKLIVILTALLMILSGCSFNLKKDIENQNIEGSEEDPSVGIVSNNNDVKDGLDISKLVYNIKNHLDTSDYLIISADSYNYADNTLENNHKSHMEMLIDREDSVSCILTESGLGYYDYNTGTSYLSSEDATSFYKMPNNKSMSMNIEDNFRMMFDDFYNVNKEFTLDEIKVDNNGIKVASISNLYKVEGSDSYYRLSIVANADNGIPYSIDVCHIEKEATVETSDGTVTGTDFISARNYYLINVIDENHEEFSMFKSAIQLPSDDECIELTE
jgi:hypothetical protein